MANKYAETYIPKQYIEDDNLKIVSHPYLRLAQGIIIQAVRDGDVDYLNSAQGQTLIDSLQLSQQKRDSLIKTATRTSGKLTRKVLWQNKYLSVAELAKHTGIKYQILYDRIFTRGWDVDKAVSAGSRVEVKKNYTWHGRPTTLSEVSKRTGIRLSTLYNRIHKYHMTLEEAVDRGSSIQRKI